MNSQLESRRLSVSLATAKLRRALLPEKGFTPHTALNRVQVWNVPAAIMNTTEKISR
jgi:hypothetical protein